MATRASTKVLIPHPNEPNCSICGILEQVDPAPLPDGRKIALILHGAAGHKDYLFQKRLSARLMMDSFRFDFRGNHETPGRWGQGALRNDVEDLVVVTRYLEQQYGYSVDLIVGHSRGSIAAMSWICTTEAGKKVSGFVNVAGRYRMKEQYFPGALQINKSFEAQGYHIMTANVARKITKFKILPEDFKAFMTWDTSIVCDHFPANIDVLTMHGLLDKVVPPYDAVIYAAAFGNRAKSHSLHLDETADHNFTGRQDEVVDVILDWWATKQRGELKTGVWRAGVKGKL
ncbi:Alpha/Beta hydrolase protein [Mycena floridula]|nr:Alpha/Beta hydrolase protein [Mycena floridula]